MSEVGFVMSLIGLALMFMGGVELGRRHNVGPAPGLLVIFFMLFLAFSV